ncbi:MAG: phosphate regulon transcriptional regulator PhoB [Proteobacteria bacterium]|nr:phosphate regulon transcriptional regulator PhoB [Pseudomonadota bacterium]
MDRNVTNERIRILVVEDDPSLVELLRYNLEAEEFAVSVANDGDGGLEAIRASTPDLVILDWMLPNTSGIEICRQIRRRAETKRTPVIMLTAKGEEADRVRGLETGADDYIVKPFSPAELTARINAVLRRAIPIEDGSTLSYEDIRMDLTSHRVSRGELAVKLGPTEYRLLKALMERPGRVYSREQLLDKVWGQDIHVEVRTVDVHIRRLRKALNEGGGADLVRTVRSAGYSLDTAKY